MKIPIDIELKIDELFSDHTENREVKNLIERIFNSSLHVGAEQLARSILVISDRKIATIKMIIDSEYFGDPRDIIMQAEAKLGSPRHYFLLPFDKIDFKNRN